MTTPVRWAICKAPAQSPRTDSLSRFDAIPDFEDFGYGCWLWGAAEVHALARQLEEGESALTATEIAPADDEDGDCYDLLGRRVVNPTPGNLYIRNHRLIIMKR